MIIHVSRSGQEIGRFPMEEWEDARRSGAVVDTDLAWHDGLTDWISVRELADAVRPAQPPALPPSPPRLPANPETSKAAVRSLIYSILGWSPILPVIGAVIGVICGHKALRSMKANPGRFEGQGLAVSGLVVGYLNLGLVVAFLGSVALFVLRSDKASDKRTTSRSNVHHIVNACRDYAEQHEGRLPDRLEDLVPTHLPSADILVSPFRGSADESRYHYVKGLTLNDDPMRIIVYDPGISNGGRVVGFLSGQTGYQNPMKPMPPTEAPQE